MTEFFQQFSSSPTSAPSLLRTDEDSRSWTKEQRQKPLPPPVLVYHESARSIVFRDHVRRVSSNDVAGGRLAPHQEPTREESSFSEPGIQDPERDIKRDLSDLTSIFLPNAGADLPYLNENNIQIQGFQPNIVPLQQLELGANDEYFPLLERSDDEALQWTAAEREVVQLINEQRAVVKTIKNSDWTNFLMRFRSPHKARNHKRVDEHDDIAPHGDYHFNSFVTSTTLLPAGARKMRCYGSPTNYPTGIIFALPDYEQLDETEEDAVRTTHTWSWPSGYSAKTEFNIDGRGQLINGRKEALVSFQKLRELNDDFLHKKDYVIGGRIVYGGLTSVPYNEVFVRVGGLGRIVNGVDVATKKSCREQDGTGRSLHTGVGLPVALFVRTNTFGHLMSLFRTRARLAHIFGENHTKNIPLLLITVSTGVRVFSEAMQHDVLKLASRSLNPFQNPSIAHKTKFNDNSADHLETKLEELIELDESIRTSLTPEECAKLAGGFGATDESVAQVLKDALVHDNSSNIAQGSGGSHRLQDTVNEGLSSAVRAGDYHTARQLLILYTLVASEGNSAGNNALEHSTKEKRLLQSKSSFDSNTMLLEKQTSAMSTYSDVNALAPPPPPPLDTDRLRSATNSDGLLAVLGAAQVLKAMKDGTAQKRTRESIAAIEEWIECGQQSMAFRLASWRNQRAAQGDLRIATNGDSNFMAFVSNKAISNRKTFARQMKEAAANTDFKDVRFLHAILEILSRMHSPCLRLELLQYLLGLDNRYSVAHVKRSVELAATCLSIATVSV